MKEYLSKIDAIITGYLKLTIVIVSIFFSVGIAGMTVPLTRPLFIKLIPYTLVACFLLLMLFHDDKWNKRTVVFFSGVFVLSWIIEAAGVNTGIIFGEYSYGNGLGIKMLGTPLIIGLNWVFLLYTTSCITAQMSLKPYLAVPVASLLMVLYDFVMEPAAPVLDMWVFDGGTAPVKNFAAWFIIAFIFHLLLKISGIKFTNRLAFPMYLIQFLFFGIISLSLILWP